MLYLWSHKIRNTQVVSMFAPELSRCGTVGQWYTYFRDVCSYYLVNNPVVLGGPGRVVEIDETHLGGRRKYNRGRHHNGVDQWIFTLFERERKLCAFILVPDRKKETLHREIQRMVAQGTIIHSDEWPSYNGLNRLGYQHLTVNHSIEFVGTNGAHIQNLESIHGELKAEFKIIRGLIENNIAAFLDEFVFRKVHRERDIFDVMLECIAQQYVFEN